jgi:hypothetical protein
MLELLERALDAAQCSVFVARQVRHFAVRCAQTVCSFYAKKTPCAFLKTAKRFLAGTATMDQVHRSWVRSHGITTPAGAVGMAHRCVNAAAVIACAHTVNPDPFAGARWAAHFAATAHVWNRVKVPKEYRDRVVVFDLHQACELLGTNYQVDPNLYSATEHQVRREIEAAQAEELRCVIPNPFGEVTWARLGVVTDGD